MRERERERESLWSARYTTAGQAHAAFFYHRQRHHIFGLRPPYEEEVGVQLVQHLDTLVQHNLWMYACLLDVLLAFTMGSEPSVLQHDLCWRFFLTFLFRHPVAPIPADAVTYTDNWVYYNNRHPTYRQMKEEDQVDEPQLSTLVVQCASLGAQLLNMRDGTDGFLRDALCQLTDEKRSVWLTAVPERLYDLADLHPFFRPATEDGSLL